MSVNFIRDNYDIIYQSSQIENPEDAKVFVLGEWHVKQVADESKREIAEDAQYLIKDLIESCAQQHSAIFIEGADSMEDLKAKCMHSMNVPKGVDPEEFAQKNPELAKMVELSNELALGLLYFAIPVSS